ncbi:MAG: aldehyde ferredoxin oxidoreductase C-terminal domain-containing protein [SAR324 cluster bacterium]|nr:hypothetical protein [Deltaproteobacteria bacterium]MDP6093981.1 aldehyde ferredoxin oxidoreductase C-terminal domain-containing protein [SAR324 cluster bacterium]MBI12085.1 hypothetical protein [Deltaproteobacteria bacterium]MBP44332.1 hypothetical protein [Deltaproteobacteria bacterium]MDP6249172.1 aldehyde ferredoxin oxidoreductase C-terminal domain-containing protein [SAR324 cluster bacterium]
MKADVPSPRQISDYSLTRADFDLDQGSLNLEQQKVQDEMDFLGGIGRSFKIMNDYQVEDPFAPESPLVINIGCLTGTAYMTGLRTYFTAYSPLKRTLKDAPMAGWSTMSGSFGRKFHSTGLDDLVLLGRAPRPSILVLRQGSNGPEISLDEAPEAMIGARTPDKFKWLNEQYNQTSSRKFHAHFATIGPAGENWEKVWYACILGSTQEQLMSGEDKFRFAGRLGMGSVLGSKNILAVVAHAEKDDSPKGDARLKSINQEIGRGDQSKGYRHPINRDGGGGTGRLERVLDINGVLPVKNFAPEGENLAEPVHIETIRDSKDYVIIDKQCFGCQISCHQDVYAASPEGKDPDVKKARKEAGPYVGRYEFEPMELTGPNLCILDPQSNLELARLTDDLGFDSISVGVTLGYLMDRNERGGEPVAGGLRFGDAKGAARVMEDIAYGREPLFGKGVKKISEEIGGSAYAMHSKGVEHSAYLPQTNPGYPFATAGGHMSMRTFLLYINDPQCQPESVDYWVEQITNQGWKMINNNLHGGCLFTLGTPQQTVEAISSVTGVEFSSSQLLDATYKAHLLGFALEQKQGATVEDYTMADEVFVGEAKGDLPRVHFMTKDLYEGVREKVLEKFTRDARESGYLS